MVGYLDVFCIFVYYCKASGAGIVDVDHNAIFTIRLFFMSLHLISLSYLYAIICLPDGFVLTLPLWPDSRG